jgi:hypothetical protein
MQLLLRELAAHAWRYANGDVIAAVKLLRDRCPDLGLLEAARIIQELHPFELDVLVVS